MEVISLKVLNLEGLQYLVSKIKGSTVECAKKLSNTSAIGSATKPVYFNANGVPVAGKYTLGAACEKGVSSSVVSGNTNLVTSDAVASAISTATNYEEGTWTPTFPSLTSISDYDANYIKIGNIVFCKFAIDGVRQKTKKQIYISRLPYVADDMITSSCIGDIELRTNTSSDDKVSLGFTNSNGTKDETSVRPFLYNNTSIKGVFRDNGEIAYTPTYVSNPAVNVTGFFIYRTTGVKNS